MTPADALAQLTASRDAERDAPVWHDGGRRTVTRLARLAGVRVEYVHVDMAKQTSERRIVEPTNTTNERGK